MTNYLIVSKNIQESEKLWDRFYRTLKKNGESIKIASRIDLTIFIDDDKYQFCTERYKNNFIRGFRGEIISGNTFERMLKNYNKNQILHKELNDL